jgi:hypothetical protein
MYKSIPPSEFPLSVNAISVQSFLQSKILGVILAWYPSLVFHSQCISMSCWLQLQNCTSISLLVFCHYPTSYHPVKHIDYYSCGFSLHLSTLASLELFPHVTTTCFKSINQKWKLNQNFLQQLNRIWTFASLPTSSATTVC